MFYYPRNFQLLLIKSPSIFISTCVLSIFSHTPILTDLCAKTTFSPTLSTTLGLLLKVVDYEDVVYLS